MSTRKSVLVFAIVPAMAIMAGQALAQVPQDDLPSYVSPEKRKLLEKPEPQPGDLLLAEADLTFEIMEHDFGNVYDSDEVSFDFKFTNKGAGPLRISQAQASCGCTVPDLKKKEYQGGESGVITVQYHPKHKKGQQQQTIRVTSNDPQHPELVLTIKANVSQLVTLDPPSVYMAAVPKNETRTTIVRVTGQNPDFKVTNLAFAAPNTPFTARVVDTKQVPNPAQPGQMMGESTIEIALKPTATAGNQFSQLNISTSDPKAGQVQCTVSAQIQPDLNVNPPRVTFVGEPGQNFTQTVTVGHRAGKPFQIKNSTIVSRKGEVVPIQVAVAPNAEKTQYTVTLNGLLPPNETRLDAELTLVTDVPGEEQTKVQVLVANRPKGQLQPPNIPNLVKPGQLSPGKEQPPVKGQPPAKESPSAPIKGQAPLPGAGVPGAGSGVKPLPPEQPK